MDVGSENSKEKIDFHKKRDETYIVGQQPKVLRMELFAGETENPIKLTSYAGSQTDILKDNKNRIKILNVNDY